MKDGGLYSLTGRALPRYGRGRGSNPRGGQNFLHGKLSKISSKIKLQKRFHYISFEKNFK